MGLGWEVGGHDSNPPIKSTHPPKTPKPTAAEEEGAAGGEQGGEPARQGHGGGGHPLRGLVEVPLPRRRHDACVDGGLAGLVFLCLGGRCSTI